MSFFALLPERGLVRIAGPDAKDFLQRLITADMDNAEPGALLFGALLSPQGKYLFDFFLTPAAEDAFLLDIARARIPDFIKKLKLYRLKAKVEIDDHSADLAVLALWGGKPPLDLALPDPRLLALGWRAIVPGEQIFEAQETLTHAGFSGTGASDYDEHRIRLGVPDAVRDLKIDGDFPLEGLFDELNGVAFKKGCFIGQETASRMKRRGITRSKIVALDIPGGAIPPGTDVLAGDVRLGDTRSSIPGRCLALLRLDRLAAADGPVTIGGRDATADVPDWIIKPEAKAPEA
ncbi:MAG: folate-binding protein [Caulobacterales bacterium]